MLIKCLLISFVVFFSCLAQNVDIYVFTDFGGGNNKSDQPVADWQTAFEIAGQGWKLTNHPYIFVHDGASPLKPDEACVQLAAAFPYLGPHLKKAILKIVVHVVDPGVGNASAHPRAMVLRRDGTLFIGPDNGTLSLACPLDSIESIWEIDPNLIGQLTGIDLKAGGTFHGRDLFAAAAYLISSGHVSPEVIGKEYASKELQYRLQILKKEVEPPLFQQVSTFLHRLKCEEDLFSGAYFLTIIQSPFYREKAQVFLIENRCDENCIAILNQKTGNVFVGPNNGLGTSFFKGFELQDFSVYIISQKALGELDKMEDTHEILSFIQKQPRSTNPLVETPLIATESQAIRQVKGRIWVDAYGNIKTTLDTELFWSLISEGYTEVTVKLNGVLLPVILANSFSEVPSGIPFLYVGSSGAMGPNPHRSRRYIELSCNGSSGIFGADLFAKEGEKAKSGQIIEFLFTKKELVL